MEDDDYESEFEKAMNGVLHWNYRKLTSFPQVLRMRGKSIVDIYMKGNSILKIPGWIAELENLTELHLRENRLLSLPEGIGQLKSLEVLDVARNRITEIPESLTLLKSLNIFCADENMISHLPKNIGNMKALRKLFVAHNQLKYLPESIHHCVSLEEIILNQNNLSTLPSSMFRLPNLDTLSIHKNPFVYLPPWRPIGAPFLFLGSTDFLKWLTLDLFEYILENDRHPDGPFGRNLSIRSLEGEIQSLAMRGHSIIFMRKPGSREDYAELELPFSKPYKKEAGVPTLYELCVRFVHSQLALQNQDSNQHSIRDIVNSWKIPETIKNDLRTGPTAYCQACKCALFQSMILQIYDANFNVLEFVDRSYNTAVDHRTKIIACYCSPFCSKWSSFFEVKERFPNFCKNFTELDWTACLAWRSIFR